MRRPGASQPRSCRGFQHLLVRRHPFVAARCLLARHLDVYGLAAVAGGDGFLAAHTCVDLVQVYGICTLWAGTQS